MLLGIVIFTIALMNYKMKEEFLDLGMGGALGIILAVVCILGAFIYGSIRAKTDEAVLSAIMATGKPVQINPRPTGSRPIGR